MKKRGLTGKPLYDIVSEMAELTLQELRIRGGKAVLKKYGKSYMSELGKKSAAKKKLLKSEAILPIDNG